MTLRVVLASTSGEISNERAINEQCASPACAGASPAEQAVRDVPRGPGPAIEPCINRFLGKEIELSGTKPLQQREAMSEQSKGIPTKTGTAGYCEPPVSTAAKAMNAMGEQCAYGVAANQINQVLINGKVRLNTPRRDARYGWRRRCKPRSTGPAPVWPSRLIKRIRRVVPDPLPALHPSVPVASGEQLNDRCSRVERGREIEQRENEKAPIRVGKWRAPHEARKAKAIE
jgi:hypothetical protein